MQTLELSNYAPRTEGRLKSLFWPSIQSADDVEYLGTQGFWICTFVAVLSFALSLYIGHEIIGTIVLLFFYWGAWVFASTALLPPQRFSFYMCWTAWHRTIGHAHRHRRDFFNLRARGFLGLEARCHEAINPPRLRETWSDKFSDSVPSWLWPKADAVYYVFSVAFIALESVGIYCFSAAIARQTCVERRRVAEPELRIFASDAQLKFFARRVFAPARLLALALVSGSATLLAN